MKVCNQKGSPAFSLLEVIVSVAIFSFAITTILFSLESMIGINRVTRNRIIEQFENTNIIVDKYYIQQNEE
ncbi:MAG: type II secretion system GspH family protein [Spirochaetes bacterium]|nr:type II secretion system GspH family protein [Spirochaetota bacterium]